MAATAVDDVDDGGGGGDVYLIISPPFFSSFSCLYFNGHFTDSSQHGSLIGRDIHLHDMLYSSSSSSYFCCSQKSHLCKSFLFFLSLVPLITTQARNHLFTR